jgi:hypothetical protein
MKSEESGVKAFVAPLLAQSPFTSKIKEYML